MKAKSRLIVQVAVAIALFALAGVARAQDVDAIRAKYLMPVPDMSAVREAAAPGGFFRGMPGANTGTPLAFGPQWGDVFVGAGYVSHIRAAKLSNGTFGPEGKDDGAVVAGFGLGDASDALGLEVAMTSLSTFRSGFFNRTGFSFKAHRMLDNTTAIAIGVENAFIAGGGKTDGTSSAYVVASKVFVLPVNGTGLFKSVIVSGGLGNGRFRLIDDVNNDKQTVNAFGSVGLLVSDQFSVSSDWTGQDLNVGFSVVPLKIFPVSITAALADVTQTANKSARFTLGAGIGMKF